MPQGQGLLKTCNKSHLDRCRKKAFPPTEEAEKPQVAHSTTIRPFFLVNRTQFSCPVEKYFPSCLATWNEHMTLFWPRKFTWNPLMSSKVVLSWYSHYSCPNLESQDNDWSWSPSSHLVGMRERPRDLKPPASHWLAPYLCENKKPLHGFNHCGLFLLH